MVPVPVPRSALMPGSRGPQAEMVIPPRPNATVTARRQRAEDARHDRLHAKKPSSGKYHPRRTGGYLAPEG